MKDVKNVWDVKILISCRGFIIWRPKQFVVTKQCAISMLEFNQFEIHTKLFYYLSDLLPMYELRWGNFTKRRRIWRKVVAIGFGYFQCSVLQGKHYVTLLRTCEPPTFQRLGLGLGLRLRISEAHIVWSNIIEYFPFSNLLL